MGFACGVEWASDREMFGECLIKRAERAESWLGRSEHIEYKQMNTTSQAHLLNLVVTDKGY